MDKVSGKKYDLSTESGRQKHILSDSGSKHHNKASAARYAEMMQEGLVEGKIEKESIVKRYTPKCK